MLKILISLLFFAQIIQDQWEFLSNLFLFFKLIKFYFHFLFHNREVQGKMKLRHGLSAEEYETLKQFIEVGAANYQYLPH